MKPTDFFALYGPAAQAACKGTGLLASICLAQAALESGWGTSGLTRLGNNFFGMKAGTRWRGQTIILPTKEFIGGKWITVNAAFRKYATATESFKDRVQLFRSLARYQRLFQLTDAQTEARQLQECGYATDPTYPTKLMAIVNAHGLTRFDT